MKTLQIGTVTLKNRYILAPMAGVSDLPFRLLCHEYGAGLTCMEMVSAKAISYRNKKTFDMLKVDEHEHPVSLQLFGNEPKLLADTVKFLEEYPFDIIDINMGCPVPKVVKNNEGSALLRNPVLAGKIIESMAGATSKPITVKIRIGFDSENINAVEMAHIAESSGAKAVIVHGRTREQYYEGRANWKEIAKVKSSVNIPVIGNGDIFSAEDMALMEKETGVDGFLVGRGARGNPFIFREMLEFEETGKIDYVPTMEEICDVILRHAKMLIEEKGEYIGIRQMRKHSNWYLAGKRHSAGFRGRLNDISNLRELRELLSEYDGILSG